MDGHAQESNNVIVCAIASIAISAFFVFLRFFTRGCIQGQLHCEDWFILAALVFAVGSTFGVFQQIEYGLGLHVQSLTDSQKAHYLQAMWYDNLFCTLSLFATKVSIVLLYQRFLTFKTIALLTKIFLGALIILYTYIIITYFVSCIPLSSLWTWVEAGGKSGKCLPTGLYWVNSIIDNVTDLCIVLLPIPVLFKLDLPFRQKCVLFLTFSLGALVFVVSVYRLVYIEYFIRWEDFTNNATIAIWVLIEMNVAIICVSLATLKPLFTHFFSARALSHSAKTRVDTESHKRPLTRANTNGDIGGRPSATSNDDGSNVFGSSSDSIGLHNMTNAGCAAYNRTEPLSSFESSRHSVASARLSCILKSFPMAPSPSGPAPHDFSYLRNEEAVRTILPEKPPVAASRDMEKEGFYLSENNLQSSRRGIPMDDDITNQNAASLGSPRPLAHLDDLFSIPESSREDLTNMGTKTTTRQPPQAVSDYDEPSPSLRMEYRDDLNRDGASISEEYYRDEAPLRPPPRRSNTLSLSL